MNSFLYTVREPVQTAIINRKLSFLSFAHHIKTASKLIFSLKPLEAVPIQELLMLAQVRYFTCLRSVSGWSKKSKCIHNVE